jgi:PAS domain S-box-containing protein
METSDLDQVASAALYRANGLQVVVDRHGAILLANENWLRLAADHAPDPRVCGPGANYFAVCRSAAAAGETVAQQVLDACIATLADATPRVIEYTCGAPQDPTASSSFWYRLRIVPLADHRLLLEHLDVSESQAIVRRAHESASRAAFERLVLKSVAQPVIATDLQGIITYWNEAAVSLFGFTADEVLGRLITEVTVPETSREQAEAIMQALSRGESWTGEFLVQHRDGTRFPARITDIPIIDGDGDVVGIVGVSDDLRPQYAREAEQQRVRELESQLLQSQKLEALGTVAGGVAHEFNNVLAAILGEAELLRARAIDDGEANASIENIIEATERGRSVVQSLLTYSRPQSGERTPIDAEQWFRSAMRMVEPIIPATVDVRSTFEAPPTSLMANDTQLTQILLNLASNAGYAMRHTPARELRIGAYRERSRDLATGRYTEWFVLDVSDTGTGMDRAVLARVFDPFFTTKPLGDGSGLGLAVVYGLVHAHEGVINVVSEPHAGTTVSVRLPVTRAVPTPMSTAPAPMSLADVSILLVDDDPMVLRALTRTLQYAGATVTGMSSPLQALHAVHAGTAAWTVAVVDYAMPGMRGDELAWAWANAGRTLPVLLCTGNAGLVGPLPPLVRRVLQKPITGAVLTQAIREVVASLPAT